MHRKVAAALVAVLALGLASCGGSQKTETVSRAQLVSRLEAACRTGEQAGRRALPRRPGQVDFMIAQRESLQTSMDQIDHLETTGSAKADFDAYKRTVRARLAALGRIADADGADQQRAVVAELPAINDAGTRAHHLILALGVNRGVCF